MNNNFFHSLTKFLKYDDEYSIGWIAHYLKKYKENFVIFGSGKDGEECLKRLLKAGVENVCVVDNNPAGKILCEIPVSHCNLIDKLENPVVIIATRKYEDEIERQVWNEFGNKCRAILSYTDIITSMMRQYLIEEVLINKELFIGCKKYMKQNAAFMYGNFSDWDSAVQLSGNGYSETNIIDLVSESTQKVRNGEAEFERDGVVFQKKDYNFQVLSAILYVISKEESLNILDLGGALGSTYFQNRELFSKDKIKWNIVEQDNYVEYGQRYIPEINFYFDLNSCFLNEEINCVLISNSLQYIPEAYSYLNEIMNKNKIKYIIFDSLPISNSEDDIIMLQNVPESIYKATYPIRIFSKRKILELINESNYELVMEWNKGKDNDVIAFNSLISNVEYFGYLFKRF